MSRSQLVQRRAPMPAPRRAWTMLALGTGAQTAGTIFVSAPAFLIPLLHTERGLSLAHAGLLASAPTVGLMLTLFAWGALADRIGEKWVISAGLALTTLAAVGALISSGYLALGAFFVLGGMGAASSSAASGRVVMGWFPKDRRGLAMGIRQVAQPLGTTIAAVTVPTAADSSISAALLVPLLACAVLTVACVIGIVDPPRTPAPVSAGAAAGSRPSPSNPYRTSSFLWRIHLVSGLLVVPQFTLSLFGLVWLVSDLHWTPLSAGVLIGISQFVGAIGRIAVGVLSDRLGSRVRLLRRVSIAACVAMLLLAAANAVHFSAAAVVILVIATTISVADNGLAFTSVAEVAGSAWAGRALGIQNTGQFLAASLVGPACGALVGAIGYPLTFVVSALAPALATPLIPRADDEQDLL